MKGRRPAPDRKSPVQPARTGFGSIAIVVAIGSFAVWTLRDTWVDPNSSPGPRQAREADFPTIIRDSSVGAQGPRGNLQSLFRGEDYPLEALRSEDEGTVGVTLQIDATGRVINCAVASSSGSKSLDAGTCKILRERASFSPARDETGKPIPSSYSQRVTWKLEDWSLWRALGW
jgi:TonB family protein